MAAEQAARARWAAFRARHHVSAPLWAKVVATVAKQRLWPLARHGFALHNLDGGTRDIALHWLPERRMWAIWLRVNKEVYAETRPKLINFVVGIDDLLSRAERGEQPTVLPLG